MLLPEVLDDSVRISNFGPVVIDDIRKFAMRRIFVKCRERFALIFVRSLGHFQEEDEFRHVGRNIRQTPGWDVAVNCEDHCAGLETRVVWCMLAD